MKKPDITLNLETFIPFIPCATVIIDYALTFHLAGSIDTVLAYEASPFLKAAIEHEILIAYILFTVLFYYLASFSILKLLRDQPIYSAGIAIIILISITHVLGGLSWFIQRSSYSNAVFTLSLTTIGIAILSSGYLVLRGAESI